MKLISKGLKVDEKNIYGQTPLYFAAAGGHKEVIELFFKEGYDINVKTNDGRTPIHFARENGKKEVEDFLVKKDAYSGKRQFPEIRGKYLGQREPGLKPEVFAPGIISTNEYGEHSFPAFSPDYKEVYWSAYFRGQQTIFFMKTENGKWSPPKIAPFSGTYDDGNPSFSFDGKYTKREKLDEINTEAFEIGPYIAPDESFIIFESNRPGGKGGIDLYICFRDSDDSWSEAINLGNTINTKESERFPGISPDGKFLFYLGHTRDIYWVDAKIIEELKPKEEVSHD